MQEKDEQILKLMGLYGVVIRAVLEALFFMGRTCDHVINRLIHEKRIWKTCDLPGRIACYQPTLSEARTRGIPDHRARPRRGGALRKTLQVLWFCSMMGKKRRRIERNHLGHEFGKGKGMGKPHCAEVEGERAIIYRIYTPGPNSRDDYLLKVLQEDYKVALESERLRDWIQNGAFGFAVLVEREKRKEKLLRMIAKDGPSGISILVEVVPGLGNMAAAIAEFKKKGGIEPDVSISRTRRN